MRPPRRALPLAACAALAGALGCTGEDPAGLGPAGAGTGPQVTFDVFRLPLPEIPLPNDFATRVDPTSPTRLRLNPSIAAGTTDADRAARRELAKLTGWGTLAPITVSFSAPLDVEVLYQRHHQDPPDFTDDAVLVLDVTPGSPGFCAPVPLDLGQGNYPQVLPDPYEFPADPRAGLSQLVYEETEEDVNHNGTLDYGEDIDGDGVLDHPNTRDGKPGGELLDFYERETNTLVMKPMIPMREATTYAVVLTKRLTGLDGQAVRSPFRTINDAAQTTALAALPACLGKLQLSTADVAFTWSFTTQSLTADYVAVRDGLYGLGRLGGLARAFAPEVSKLYDVAPADAAGGTPKLVRGAALLPLLANLQGDASPGAQRSFAENFGFIDFTVVGEYASPQFFPRADDAGAPLPLYDQVWDLARAPRAEAVPFWLFVPKHRTGPAPVALFVHGHGGSKFSAIEVAGVLARHGVATLAIDAPGHGVSLDDATRATVDQLFAAYKLGALENALLVSNRALDWNGDGRLDPGADFWTAYAFHTRDQVRQTAVDLMQAVRVLRGFDGTARWPAALGAGGSGLAGDFDGDGVVDVGGAAPLSAIGGSLGGITGALLAGVEPALDGVVSIVPGGMLSEIGARSALDGVKVAINLRQLGPIFYSTGGATRTLMAAVNDAEGVEADVTLGDLPTLARKDTVVAVNLRSGEYRCGGVQADGSFRVAVPSDRGDPLELRAFAGPLPAAPRTGCALPADGAPKLVVNTFGREVALGGTTHAAGSRLVALADGFGLRRATPELRRMIGVGQLALDAADPMNFAPYWEQRRALTYGNGEEVRTNVWLLPSAGDPGVCVASGVALARAAGFISYEEVDPAYGKTPNQVLIDSYAVEGVSRLARFTDADGRGVLMDVAHLAAITGADDGFGVPRLSPPLRSTRTRADGGASGALIVMLDPQGAHGFATPDPDARFDVGTLLVHMIGRYLATGGKALAYDACQVTASCSWIPPVTM